MQTSSRSGFRTLVLMRHAKADGPAADDHARWLVSRGTADAADAGTWLAAQGLVPDRALVSSAARTVATWEAVAGAAGYHLTPDLDDGMYAAGPESALDLVRLTDDAVGTLLVIGHNPTIAYLAQTLEGGDGDTEATAAMAAGYPTSALAVLEVDGPWSDLDLGGARLVAFHAPG